MNQLKYIVGILLSLIPQPEEFWQKIANTHGPESRSEEVQKNFFLPLLGYMSLIVFLCASFRSEASGFDYQHGMKQTVPVVLAYFIGPFLAVILLNLALSHFFKLSSVDKNRVQVFVFYSTSFIMAVEVLLAIIPSIQFFKFIFIYLIFITFSGSTTFIRVPVRHRWLFGIMSFLVIWSCPSIITMLMHRLQG